MSSIPALAVDWMSAGQPSDPLLGASITRAASKQTYYTIRFLVDRGLVADAYRAYGYFRWVDDQLDQSGLHSSARLAFIKRQEALVDHCYQGNPPRRPTREESLLVDLIRGEREKNSGLQSYIRNMLAVMAFDAERRGRLVSAEELNRYTHYLAIAVTEAMHYFIGHNCQSPHIGNRYLAVSAAHITHMLRDTLDDIGAGYFNIPREYVESYGMDPSDPYSEPYRNWTRSRVALARACFQSGREYLAQVENPRCRLAGFAYTARFTGVLDTIERDDYFLRSQYPESKTLATGMKMGWSVLSQAFGGHRPGHSLHVPSSESGKMKTNSVVVIGAGVGGIAAAAHLARRGLHVTVVEKNSRAGGRCDRFSRDGHIFDTGPTLLVMPLLYEAEFAALGASARDMLDLRRVDPTYELVFDDGRNLALTSDPNSMREQLESIQPGSYPGFLRYLEEGRRHYDLAMDRLVNRDFRKASDFFALRNLPLLFKIKPLVPHYRNMSAYFDDPRLKSAFTFQDVYMGLSPFEAPATFSMMSYTELAHGVWYPRGGMYRVVEALMEIAIRAGVEFVFDTTVERIEVDGMRARGVILEDGQRLEADAVLANADLPYVYKDLLPQDGMADQLERKRFSCSVVSFFWGVDKTYDALGPHTLFLADDYRENFESIIRDLSLPKNPSLYVHAPARLDPSMSPPGEDTLTAIVPVGHLSKNDGQDWGAIRDQARQEVFRRLRTLGITDLESHLKFEMTFTPLSWRKRYNLMKGSTHGLCHNLTQLAYFRPSNRHPRYHNLYFVGASTRPGTGIPTALVSARLGANRILDDLGMAVASK